jgi:hypothetical protein
MIPLELHYSKFKLSNFSSFGGLCCTTSADIEQATNRIGGNVNSDCSLQAIHPIKSLILGDKRKKIWGNYISGGFAPVAREFMPIGV